MRNVFLSTLVVFLFAGCGSSSGPPVVPDPEPVDLGPAIVEISGRFGTDSNLYLLSDFRVYYLALTRQSDGAVVRSQFLNTAEGHLNGTGEFHFQGLYFDRYRILLRCYDPRLVSLQPETLWSSEMIEARLSAPVITGLDFRPVVDTGVRSLAYDLYLSGSEPSPDDAQYIYEGIRLVGDPDTTVYPWLIGRWAAVLAFVEGPWDIFHFDFNNNGEFREPITYIPEGDYFVGVYAVYPDNPNELVVYGESTESMIAFTDWNATSDTLELHVDFDHPVIRELP